MNPDHVARKAQLTTKLEGINNSIAGLQTKKTQVESRIAECDKQIADAATAPKA